MARLSELEGCVLGLLGVSGPATPYALRQEFLRSPSPHWSGSAGAIYPLVERLERRNWLRSEPHSTGQRRSRRYRLTPAGLRVLRHWLGPPFAARTIGVPSDPLRTRMEFIVALPARQQARFLLEAESKVRQHLRVVVEDCKHWKQRGNFTRYWTARGALQMLEARLDWIRAYARAISREPHHSPSPGAFMSSRYPAKKKV